MLAYCGSRVCGQHRPQDPLLQIADLCAELNVTVIAEGIESAGERDFLADCGIFLMQGYWFAKPAFKALAQVTPGAWTR